MTSPTAPPSAGADQQQPRRGSDRFFAWTSGLGLARSDGWIGGVAAGIASRLGIDPLIVRGVLVVATVCGLPLILLYAIAWALLPDHEGRIHLRDLLHGRFQPAQLGILGGVIIGLSTLTPSAGLFLLRRMLNPYEYFSPDEYGVDGFRVFGFLLGSALVIVLLVLIVRAARRTSSGGDPRTPVSGVGDGSVPPAPFAPASAGARDAAAATHLLAAPAPTGTADAAMPVPPPVGPPASGTAADMEAWRAQHAGWQQQEQAWRLQQQDAERAARDQARRERQAAATAFAAEAAERRRMRRASNPRAGFAYVATTIGLALVVGAIVWLWTPERGVTTAALALLSAALVFAFGMIIAGVARRRSGFLAIATVTTLIAGLITGGAATVGDVRFGDVSVSNTSDDGSIRQPFGNTSIHLINMSGIPSRPVVVHKGGGYTEILVNPGVELQLTATVGEATVQWQRTDFDAKGEFLAHDEGTFAGTQRADGTTVYREAVTSPPGLDAPEPDAARDTVSVPVTIEQESGQIVVFYSTRTDSTGTDEEDSE